MKRFATTYSNGHHIESSSWGEARNFLYADPDQQVFFLSGQVVTVQQFVDAVNAAEEKYMEKKNETHKKVRVRHGASVLGFETKWVRR